MKLKKALLLVVSALLLMSITVVGTLAYLTDTDEVTNTFTVGNVIITLDEADVDDSDKDGDTTERDQENKYHLLPGKTYAKDPTVHVDDDSEDCWLFVEITNGIADIEAEGNTTVAAQMDAHGWTLVPGETNVYAYEKICKAGDNVVVFETIKIAGDVPNDELANYANATIEIVAYAIQAEGFSTSDAAWAAGDKPVAEGGWNK